MSPLCEYSNPDECPNHGKRSEPDRAPVPITDEMVERAIRAEYDAFPSYRNHKPISYEECHGHPPMEQVDDVKSMRFVLDAAINGAMPEPGIGDRRS